jgi:hypothetical protein
MNGWHIWRVTWRVTWSVALAMAAPAHAQWLDYPTAGVPRLANGQPNLSAPAPRTADGKPDLSGIWIIESAADPTAGGAQRTAQFWDIDAGLKGGLPYQPWAADTRKAREAENSKTSPGIRCLPIGILQMHTVPFPWRLVQAPGYIAILHEREGQRQIFTDGRPLLKDPQPSWLGYSTGKWEGDTLVVQTNGFRDGLWADNNGNPLTSAAKITERFRRPNFGRLEIEATVDDPKAYTKPWTVKINEGIQVDTDILEYVCAEGERDAPHIVGK